MSDLHEQFRKIEKDIFNLTSDELYEYISRPNVLIITKQYLTRLVSKRIFINEALFLYSFVIYRFPYEVFEKERATKKSELYESRIELIKNTKGMLDSLYDFQNNLDSNRLRNVFTEQFCKYIKSFVVWKPLNKSYVISQIIRKLNKINEISPLIKESDPFQVTRNHLLLSLEMLGVKKEDIPNIQLKDELDESESISKETMRKQISNGDYNLVGFYLDKICKANGISFDILAFEPTLDNFRDLFDKITQKITESGELDEPDCHILHQLRLSFHSDISNLIPQFIDCVLLKISHRIFRG